MIVKVERRFSSALREGTRRKIEHLRHADIVVGIPSYNSADTIENVIETVARGLEKHYPDFKSVIFVSDGGSTDDTREIALEVDTQEYGVEKIVSIYRGIPGKGSAVRAVFEASEFLKVRAVALFDSDLRSITVDWVKNIVEPIMEGYDFVAPDYRRYKFDATITNTIAYNLTRALYGYRVKQPIGGDFGVSLPLVKFYLDQDVWETAVAKFGIDIWMTTNAIVNGFKICQARLGAKIHRRKDPAKDLSPMFREVVGTIFLLMEEYEGFWKRVKGSKPVPTFGEYVETEVEPFKIDRDELIDYFKIGYRNFSSLWKGIVDDEDFQVLKELYSSSGDDFVFPVDSWVRVVYRYANTFHSTPRQKFKILNTMIPLYHARVASLINELDEKTNEEVERYFELQAERFEELKPYLLKIWR